MECIGHLEGVAVLLVLKALELEHELLVVDLGLEVLDLVLLDVGSVEVGVLPDELGLLLLVLVDLLDLAE